MKPWKSIASNVLAAVANVLQWGHGDEAVEEAKTRLSRIGSNSFNGATAMKPWKSTITGAAYT